MKRLNPYISVLFALLLVASPWLQVQEVKAAPVEDYCGCCQGPCEGCCCAASNAADQAEDSSQPKHSCSCSMSAIPVHPEFPMEFQNYRTTEHVGDIELVTIEDIDQDIELDHKPVYNNFTSPESDVPVYLLYGAFLI